MSVKTELNVILRHLKMKHQRFRLFVKSFQLRATYRYYRLVFLLHILWFSIHFVLCTACVFTAALHQTSLSHQAAADLKLLQDSHNSIITHHQMLQLKPVISCICSSVTEIKQQHLRKKAITVYGISL